MSYRTGLIALASLVGTHAVAQECPNGQTAKVGYVLERQGSRAEIRPSAENFVHALNTYPDGTKQDVIYYRGFFEVSRRDNVAHRFRVPLSDLRSIFPLDAKARRAVTYVPAEPTKVGTPVSLEITVTGQETLRLGSCSYTVTIVRNRLVNGEGRTLSEHTDLYSPELGFVLGKRYEERGGRLTTVVYQNIRPLARAAPL
ncbi:hypothetical protein [Microvirga thermotolerans]|uniref:Uncharacterized protein n=1 Tax=Microvirga thermotolerans TaxID=2651334 RepID=A0A5P9JRK0_9HYPH|nr:hypothetical protein [Microvirga thermotolerans]QFU15372.1 hypothetical protein GDR74_03570 [Microvirga thermotolerans]